jgi:hypothetical protein
MERANSLESGNVQLKVPLEEATKELDTWKVNGKAEIAVSHLFSPGGRRSEKEFRPHWPNPFAGWTKS